MWGETIRGKQKNNSLRSSSRDARERHDPSTAILTHTTHASTSSTHINLLCPLLRTRSTTSTAGINNTFLDIRGERKESLFHIDV
jgi:hypothetical protein